MLPQQTSEAGARGARSAGQCLKAGVAAFRAGDKAGARTLVAEAARLKPGNELVWLWTASTAANRTEALRALERVLEINPRNAKALQWIERLRPSVPTPVEDHQPAPDQHTPAPRPSEEDDPIRAALREKTRPIDPPPAATSKPSPEQESRPISDETCLLCGDRLIERGACGSCKAILDIDRLDDISRNDSVDRPPLLTAVERFRKELETGPSVEANLGLALAYLNLKQSNDALPRLSEACRLQPDNADLRRCYERLRSRRLVLAVDDSKTVQQLIAGVLEKELYRVALAEDGLQALARLDDETPALMLVDISMPRMDGYQVARIISGNQATAAIPVVMLSGKDGFFDRIRGKLAGAKGYVAKPFYPEELISTIKRCLDE